MNYHVLLAMLETGAHDENLYPREDRMVTDIEGLEKEVNPMPVSWASANASAT